MSTNYIATEKPRCLRCGRCCHFPANGQIVKCKHLITLPSGKTLCRIYNKRLGTTIHTNPLVKCGMRNDVRLNFKNCEYNKPGQPMMDVGY
jgi:hypothetical protein